MSLFRATLPQHCTVIPFACPDDGATCNGIPSPKDADPLCVRFSRIGGGKCSHHETAMLRGLDPHL